MSPLLTSVTATLCEYSHHRLHRKLLSFWEVWVCPWPCGGRERFLISLSLSFSVLTGKLIRIFGSEKRASLSVYVQRWSPIEPRFVFMCFHLIYTVSGFYTCVPIWPQPAEYPTACLFLLPRERALVWARSSAKLHGFDGQHHTLYLVPERVPACTQGRLGLGLSVVKNWEK